MSSLPGIQVLRALAAFMVAVHHVQPDAASLAQRGGAVFTPSSILPWMAGVDIFFVVSGFIMVHASQGLFGRPGATRLFLARRIARIVPLYWAATTLFLLVVITVQSGVNSGVPGPGQIAASYLFWPSVSTMGLIQPVFSLGWTLNFEMLFYVVFGFALMLPRPAVVPVVALILAGLVAANEVAGPLPLPFGFWGQPIVLEFALGMVIALLRERGFRLSGAARWLAALLGVLVLAFAARWPGAEQPWAAFALHGLAATLLVLAAASGEGRSAPSALVRGLAQIGDASYALYLVHPFVMRGLRAVFLLALPAWPGLFVLAALAASVIAALIVHRGFERPATAWLRQRLRA